jgi:hypothetical protein
MTKSLIKYIVDKGGKIIAIQYNNRHMFSFLGSDKIIIHILFELNGKYYLENQVLYYDYDEEDILIDLNVLEDIYNPNNIYMKVIYLGDNLNDVKNALKNKKYYHDPSYRKTSDPRFLEPINPSNDENSCPSRYPSFLWQEFEMIKGINEYDREKNMYSIYNCVQDIELDMDTVMSFGEFIWDKTDSN